MQSFQDILKLCEDEDGKVFILNHKGDLQLVVLGAKLYHKMKNGSVESSTGNDVIDAEVINKQITQAQLMDDGGVKEAALVKPDDVFGGVGKSAGPVSLKSVLQNWHRQPQKAQLQEVIDPSWDEDGLGFSV